MKETNIDSMKYRKSTHLAGVDVEMIVAEKKRCILTIKECYFERGVNVSGNKTDGYFIVFKESVKDLVVNSTNRKTIGNIVKTKKQLSSVDSRNIGNWNDVVIELIFDPTVKMMGKAVGGIKVAAISPIIKIDTTNALAILNECKTQEQLIEAWTKKLTKEERTQAVVLAKKEELKKTLTNEK